MQITTSPQRLDSLSLLPKIQHSLQRIIVDELKDQYDCELSSIWNELGTFLVVLDQDESIESCPPLASQLTYSATYPEIVESLSDGWILLLGIYSSEGGGTYIVFPENTCDPTLKAVVAQYKHTWSDESE